MLIKECAMKKIVFFILVVIFCGCVLAEDAAVKTKKTDPNREIMLAASKAHKDKDYDKSIELWRKLEEKKGSNFVELAVFGIGDALKEQGKYDEAIKQFDKLYAAEIDGPLVEKHRIMWGNRTKADGKIRTAICYMHKGEYQKALKELKMAEEVYPYSSWCGTCQWGRDPVIPTYRGMFYEKLNNYDMALRSYSKIAFKNNVLNFAVQFRIVELYQSQGKLDVLEKILDEVDKKNAMSDIEKKGEGGAEKKALRQRGTNKIRGFIKSREYYNSGKVDLTIYKSLRGVDFPPLPKKVELPESLEEMTGKKIVQKEIEIDTKEIILLLERAKIRTLHTSHSQHIYIGLKDGMQFRGKYVQAEAGRYSGDKKLFDILNLVMRIKKNVRAEDSKDWKIIME